MLQSVGGGGGKSAFCSTRCVPRRADQVQHTPASTLSGQGACNQKEATPRCRLRSSACGERTAAAACWGGGGPMRRPGRRLRPCHPRIAATACWRAPQAQRRHAPAQPPSGLPAHTRAPQPSPPPAGPWQQPSARKAGSAARAPPVRPQNEPAGPPPDAATDKRRCASALLLACPPLCRQEGPGQCGTEEAMEPGGAPGEAAERHGWPCVERRRRQRLVARAPETDLLPLCSAGRRRRNSLSYPHPAQLPAGGGSSGGRSGPNENGGRLCSAPPAAASSRDPLAAANRQQESGRVVANFTAGLDEAVQAIKRLG